jgi:benzylsuccinate CoA-transferase BbsE subunit
MAHETAVQFWDCEKFIRRRNGGHERRAGHGVYPCADGHIYLLVGAQGKFWDAMLAWLVSEGFSEGVAEFRKEQWYSNDYCESREGRERFREFFLPFSLQHGKDELYQTGKAARLPICPVNSPADILKNAQFRARDYFVGGQLPGGRSFEMPGAPFKLSLTPHRIQRPAPRLGQHDEEILAELGLTAGEVNIEPSPPPSPKGRGGLESPSPKGRGGLVQEVGA